MSSEIDATLAEKRQGHAVAVKDAKGRLAQTDLDLLALERRKADLKTDKAERGLRALTLTAPHDGIVVLERDWRGDPPRVGDTCWAGEKIAEIPDLAAMEAEVSVLEADAGGLAVGQRATVVVEGRPDAAVPAPPSGRSTRSPSRASAGSGAVLRRRAGARAHRPGDDEARPAGDRPDRARRRGAGARRAPPVRARTRRQEGCLPQAPLGLVRAGRSDDRRDRARSGCRHAGDRGGRRHRRRRPDGAEPATPTPGAGGAPRPGGTP